MRATSQAVGTVLLAIVITLTAIAALANVMPRIPTVSPRSEPVAELVDWRLSNNTLLLTIYSGKPTNLREVLVVSDGEAVRVPHGGVINGYVSIEVSPIHEPPSLIALITNESVIVFDIMGGRTVTRELSGNVSIESLIATYTTVTTTVTATSWVTSTTTVTETSTKPVYTSTTTTITETSTVTTTKTETKTQTKTVTKTTTKTLSTTVTLTKTTTTTKTSVVTSTTTSTTYVTVTSTSWITYTTTTTETTTITKTETTTTTVTTTVTTTTTRPPWPPWPWPSTELALTPLPTVLMATLITKYVRGGRGYRQ